jgi:pimeloyl-ACP methyl ester carboxylesterase
MEPYASLDTQEASIDPLTTMLTAVLDADRIPLVVLCGNSLGGLVAPDTALRYAHRVEALVISDARVWRRRPALD